MHSRGRRQQRMALSSGCTRMELPWEARSGLSSPLNTYPWEQFATCSSSGQPTLWKGNFEIPSDSYCAPAMSRSKTDVWTAGFMGCILLYETQVGKMMSDFPTSLHLSSLWLTRRVCKTKQSARRRSLSFKNWYLEGHRETVRQFRMIGVIRQG